MVMAPIVRGRKGEFKKEMEKLVQHGFARARIDGELVNLEDEIQLDKRKNHTIEVVIDRLLVKPGIEHRLELSVGLAMKLAGGLVQIAVVGGEETLYSSRSRVRIVASTFHSLSRVRSPLTAPTVPARSATASAANTISILQRSSRTGLNPSSTAGLGLGRHRKIF